MRKWLKFGLTITAIGLLLALFLIKDSAHGSAEVRSASGVSKAPIVTRNDAQLATIPTGDESSSFDKPLRKVVIKLGPSPDQPQAFGLRVELTCYYYSSFMVKELNDTAMQGAQWFSVTQASSAHVPKCAESRGAAEKIIAADWSGYFKGVKRNLVFLNGDDGYNGGYPFAIYDALSGKKLFEDSVILENSHISFPVAPSGNLLLRYLRVVALDCSLPKDGSACWDKNADRLELKDSLIPRCSGYEKIPGGDDNSVLAYPVEVALTPQPAITTLPGSVRCWAAD